MVMLWISYQEFFMKEIGEEIIVEFGQGRKIFLFSTNAQKVSQMMLGM